MIPESSVAATDALDSRDFYEVCQQYRNAEDVIPARYGLPNAEEAFEQLKAWIRKNAVIHVKPVDSPHKEDQQ